MRDSSLEVIEEYFPPDYSLGIMESGQNSMILALLFVLPIIQGR